MKRGEEYDRMEGRRTLSIGITVNLEHYENLRLEVSGQVESQEDAQELVQYLDTVLGSFGRQDPATAERIESYRRRVLSPPPLPLKAPPAGCHEGVCPLPAETELPDETPPPSQPLSGDDARSEQTPVSAATGDGICEECGSHLSPAEQKMSQLFTSRSLCRKCMKKL
jgi:hypothetical protein